MNAMKPALACVPIILVGYALVPVRAQAPGGAALPGPAASSEEGRPASGQQATGELCQCTNRGSDAAIRRINEALDGPIHSDGIEFTDKSLLLVLAELQNEYRLPIQIDTPALDEAGVGTDAPITRKIQGVSLRSALNLLLENLQLTWIIRDEVLIVTTNERAGKYLVTCVYNVNDLVDKKDPDYDNLVDAIVSCVATDTWSENGGGSAEIRVLTPGLLVVSQTQAIHEEINALLSKIRNARGLKQPAATSGRQEPKLRAARSSSRASATTKGMGGGYF